MLLKPRTERFRVSELIQYFSDTAILCEQSNPGTLNVNKQYQSFKQKEEAIEGTFKKNQKSKFTAILDALDDRRDSALLCINGVAKGYLNHYDERKRQAAENVRACIKKYGDRVYDMNRKAETSIVTNMGNEFRGELADDVETIHQTEVATEMIDANMQYIEQNINKIDEDASDNSESTRKLLDETHDAYRTLCKHIEANEVLNPSEALTVLINKLNTLTERYNQLVSLRSKDNEEF